MIKDEFKDLVNLKITYVIHFWNGKHEEKKYITSHWSVEELKECAMDVIIDSVMHCEVPENVKAIVITSVKKV